MSLQPHVRPPLPEETARVAQAACPHGRPSRTRRAALGPIFQEAACAALFPPCGQPGRPPWRLRLGPHRAVP
jgi:hypothetical protein